MNNLPKVVARKWNGRESTGLVSTGMGDCLRVCNKPTRSTQPCIPPGLLNRVPASTGVRAGMSLLPGDR